MNRLVVLAGPAAVGKGTVAAAVRAQHPDVWMSISATTRPPRPGEQNGIHYYFVTDEVFDQMIADGDLLEHAVVHGQAKYGTPRRPVEDALAAGKPCLLEIDLEGARQVKEAMPEALLVFLKPPSWDELVRRLIGRGTETQEQQERRLATAKVELAAEKEFDRVIVNHEVHAAADELVKLMKSGIPDQPADVRH